MKKILMLTGVVLISAAVTAGIFVASSAARTGGITKNAAVSASIDYKQIAEKFIAEKYGEPLEKIWIVYEASLSLPFSKAEYWNIKVLAGDHSYGVQINKADGSITENYQRLLDEEEKAAKKICGKLDKYLFQEASKLNNTETIDIKINFNMSYSPEGIEKRLNSIGATLMHEPDSGVFYATVTKKQLKKVEAIKEVNLIERFYGFPTAQ